MSAKKLKKPMGDVHDPVLLVARRSDIERWKVVADQRGLSLTEWMVAVLNEEHANG